MPDVLLEGNGKAGYTEKDLPKHINGGTVDNNQAESGIVLTGDVYIDKALAYLKQQK